MPPTRLPTTSTLCSPQTLERALWLSLAEVQVSVPRGTSPVHALHHGGISGSRYGRGPCDTAAEGRAQRERSTHVARPIPCALQGVSLEEDESGTIVWTLRILS